MTGSWLTVSTSPEELDRVRVDVRRVLSDEGSRGGTTTENGRFYERAWRQNEQEVSWSQRIAELPPERATRNIAFDFKQGKPEAVEYVIEAPNTDNAHDVLHHVTEHFLSPYDAYRLLAAIHEDPAPLRDALIDAIETSSPETAGNAARVCQWLQFSGWEIAALERWRTAPPESSGSLANALSYVELQNTDDLARVEEHIAMGPRKPESAHVLGKLPDAWAMLLSFTKHPDKAIRRRARNRLWGLWGNQGTPNVKAYHPDRHTWRFRLQHHVAELPEMEDLEITQGAPELRQPCRELQILILLKLNRPEGIDLLCDDIRSRSKNYDCVRCVMTACESAPDPALVNELMKWSHNYEAVSEGPELFSALLATRDRGAKIRAHKVLQELPSWNMHQAVWKYHGYTLQSAREDVIQSGLISADVYDAYVEVMPPGADLADLLYVNKMIDSFEGETGTGGFDHVGNLLGLCEMTRGDVQPEVILETFFEPTDDQAPVPRDFHVICNGKLYSAKLVTTSDFIDSEHLDQLLDCLVEDSGTNQRFFWTEQGRMFGNPAELKHLIEKYRL
ncbi:MAG: hypothetical protein R3C18_09675 [Planctomycetaceae bacterium]